MDYDTWKCTPPEEPDATPAELWAAVVGLAERDNTLVMHPVNIDDHGASVWVANVGEDGHVWSTREVFVTWDEAAPGWQ